MVAIVSYNLKCNVCFSNVIEVHISDCWVTGKLRMRRVRKACRWEFRISIGAVSRMLSPNEKQLYVL